MSQPGVKDDLVAALWQKIDERIDLRVKVAITEALQNLRPGGAHPFVVEIAGPTASLTVPAAKLNVDYPCVITSVDLYSDPGVSGSATVDLLVARPGETLAAATSICGANLPTLVAAESVHVEPSTDWTTFMGANQLGSSVLMPYITSVSGISSLTIAVNVRAL